MIRVQIPATTANMGPGFDTLGMALKLYNIVELEETRTGLQIDVETVRKKYPVTPEILCILLP